jgi:predicted alpha/beta superfamily hydrolase
MFELVPALAFLLSAGASQPARPLSAAIPAPPGGEAIVIASTALGESRTVWVRAPQVCAHEPACDLLVVLDGHALFPLATAYADVMQAMGRMRPLVVVGVPSPSQGARVQNFTSTVSEEDRPRYPQAGGARLFLDFLQREVVPAVASRYRLSATHTLAGHSLAGLLVVEALATGAAFSNYIAISPTLGWNREQVLNALTPVLGKAGAPKRLYVSVANDAPAYLTAFARLERELSTVKPAWILASLQRFPDDDHVTTVPPGLQGGMKWLFVSPAP